MKISEEAIAHIQKETDEINNIVLDKLNEHASQLYTSKEINKERWMINIKKRVQMHMFNSKLKPCESTFKNNLNNQIIVEDDKIKKDIFISPESHIKTDRKNVAYYVPEIDRRPIQIKRRYLNKAEQILFLNNFVSQNYSTVDNWWVDAIDNEYSSKMIPVHARRRKQITKDNSSIKIVKKIIEQTKSELNWAHLTIFNSIYSKTSNKIATEVEAEDVNYLNTDSLKDFCWKDEQNMSEMISNHFKQIKKVSKVKSTSLLDLPTKTNDYKIAYWAEMMYGSWSALLEQSLDSEEDIKFIINYMIRRAKTILYMLENPMLSLKDSKEYWDKILSFIINEMSRPLVNKKGESVVGWQRDHRYSTEDILEFPMQWILSTNSTSGRMMVCYNWESIVDHPYFVKQSLYKNVFGFCIENDAKLSSKFKLILI